MKTHRFDVRLFGVLLIMTALPSFYKMFRIHLLGNVPSDWGVNIASQIAWLDVLYEIIHEALLLPLFFFCGTILGENGWTPQILINFSERLKSIFITSSIIYTSLSAVLIVLIRKLLVFMQVEEDVLEQSAVYMRWETVGLLLSTMLRIGTTAMMFLEENGSTINKPLGAVLLIKVVFAILCDLFLLREGRFSLRLGVLAIAISNIFANAAALCVCLTSFHYRGLRIFSRNLPSFTWQKQWFKAGSLSGCESFIRNLAFMVVVLRLMNEVSEQGTFWITNSFIWSVLLLPVFALGEVIKRDIGRDNTLARSTFNMYLRVTLYIFLAWFITLPLWKTFIKVALNAQDFEKIFTTVLISMPFYIIFALNNIVDAIFYGLSRTDLMLYQSILTNGTVYPLALLFYWMNWWVPDLYSIAILFGTGIAVDSLITFVIYWILKRKNALVAKYVDVEKV
ncbi:hypothetical protein RCL1_004368 [Eukaryota sp. TZLM3-RCL]